MPFLSRPLSDGLNLADHLVAGAAATAAAVTAVHPLDTVKTVMQAAAGRRVGPLNAAVTVVRRRGLPALYSGVASSLGGQVPSGAIKFAVFETLTQWSRSRVNIPQPVQDFACAALAFVACSVAFVPGEVLKQRIQAGVSAGFLSGVRDAIRANGIRGLYTGYRATLLRDVPYTMLEFGLYTQYKRLLRTIVKRPKLRPQEEWVMGGLAGGCTGFLTTPLDLAKTRLMTQSSAAAARYTGVLDVLSRTARTEGVSGLFRGSSARVAWLVPFTAVFFGVHEASKRALRDRKSPPVTATVKAKGT